MKYKFSYFLLNIPKTSYVYHIYHHNHLLQIGSSYCLFNYDKLNIGSILHPYTGWRSAPNQNLKTIFMTIVT